MPSNLFRKIDQLGIFSLYGEVIHTPMKLIEKISPLFTPQIEEMIQNETTEFAEGFLAGLLYGGKFTELGGELVATMSEVPLDRIKEVRSVQIDTVLTILSTYLMEQRQRD